MASARPFTIYIIQSAHTDIGYTHPQELITQMYLDAYDQVLALCRHTTDAPVKQRFKWTCETSWQVKHYLTHRPEREAEFLHFVRTGQIEITASYLHFTDMIDADAYRHSLQWVVQYCQRNNLPLRTAMHCDINGWPWAVADILAEYSIPYFCSHIHLDSGTDPLGRRGSLHYPWVRDKHTEVRPDAPFRIPQAFQWQGPAGGQVLHWLGEHYLLANMLSISSSRNFNTDKTRHFTDVDRTRTDELYNVAKHEVQQYVTRLREEGYPYNILLLSSGGFFVDNAPPDERWCEVIARWNAEHDDIQLCTATLGEWFGVLQEHLLERGDTLPLYQVAWPDHWAHGLGSATARIAQARRTQHRRADVRALVEMSKSPQAVAYLETASEQELLALEHTFGAWSTTARPSASLNDFVQATKELTFHQSEMYLDQAADTALRVLLPSSIEKQPQLHVYMAEHTEDVHLVHFASDDVQLDTTTQRLVADDGSVHAFQRENQELARFVTVLPLAASALSSFRLTTAQDSGTVAHSSPATSDSQLTQLENQTWQLRIDPITGGLVSLQERDTHREWVDAKHQYTFGQLIHEVVVHPLGRQAVGNKARFVALDVATDEVRRQFGKSPIVEQMTLPMVHKMRHIVGPIFDALELSGQTEQMGHVQMTWRCYHAIPLVELLFDWNKRWSDLPEAAYVAFPFAVPQGSLLLETGGGFFQPGSHETGGQLPGTCSSYYTIQRAASISTSDDGQLLWLPLDAPLVMPNALDYSRWETEPWQWNGLLASMPVNHYWHTNFPASQRGPLRLRYRLLRPNDFSNREQAIQAAMAVEAMGWR